MIDSRVFLDNFANITDVPDGVRRLRDLVLDLAVNGRLVEQDPADEPAEELLARTALTQARLIEEGNTRPNRDHKPRAPHGPLPLGWCWTYMPRLGFVNPRNVVEPSADAGFVPMPLIPTDTRESPAFEKRRWSEISKGYTHIADGDVAIAKITPCFQNGKSAVFSGLPSGVGAATTELYVLRVLPGGANPKYLHLVLRSPRFIRGGIPEMTGTAGQQRLPRDYFTDTPIGLPPLAEQSRIVQKVDELMELCDELETCQERIHFASNRFRDSALHAFAAAQNYDDFRRAWERVSTNWDALTGDLESPDAMRRAILGLATGGRLPAVPTGSFISCALGDQITLQRGFDITKREQQPGPYPVVSSGGVLSYHSEAACRGPGVVIGRKGSVGRVHWIPEDYWPHDTTLWVKDFHGNDPEYVYWFLRSFPLLDYESSTANPSLNRNRLHPVEITWPDPKIQPQLVHWISRGFDLCDRLDSAIVERSVIATALGNALTQP